MGAAMKYMSNPAIMQKITAYVLTRQFREGTGGDAVQRTATDSAAAAGAVVSLSRFSVSWDP